MAITRRTENTPAQKRRAHIRSCAEVLRLLAMRNYFDAEARDMTAFLVLNLRGIYETINESAHAWDDRNYWKKAETLREKWRWSRTTADKLESLILSDNWDAVPEILISVIPHFGDVTINTMTRDGAWWCGAYRSLQQKASGNPS